MSDHVDSVSSDQSEEWFPEKPLEHLGAIGMGALVLAAAMAGGFSFGLIVLAFVLGLFIGGRIGTALIGAAIGFLLGGSLVGMGLGVAIGIFNAWVYEIESHRRGSTVIKQLGWINGFIIGLLMAGQMGASGLQLLLAVAIYTGIGGFVAEVVPGFLRFLDSLDEDDDEETA